MSQISGGSISTPPKDYDPEKQGSWATEKEVQFLKKGLKEFLKKVLEDESFANRVKLADSVKDVISLAEAEGYHFTEDDIMDEQLKNVAGGKNEDLIGELAKALNSGGQFLESISSVLGKI